jgi:hypothetical protein
VRVITRLPAVLDEGIFRVRLGKGNLVLTSEVEFVYAADQSRHTLTLQGLAQGLDKGRLASALDTIETDDKGAVGRLFAVEFELSEDEGQANLSFIVNEVGSHDERCRQSKLSKYYEKSR